jgi:hypothetical protein
MKEELKVHQQTISDLKTEKESLARKLELRNADFETLSSEAAQVQTTLYDTRT